MTQIQDIEMELDGREHGGGPVKVTLTVDIEFSDWEVDQNQPYYARAFVLERDGNRDEFVFYPNWLWRSWDTVADGNEDELLAYLGLETLRPNGSNTRTVTFEGELTGADIDRASGESYDFDTETEEYYPFVVVEPEMHTVMKFGGELDRDFSIPIQ